MIVTAVLYSPGGMKLLQEASERDPEGTGIAMLLGIAILIVVIGSIYLFRWMYRQ